QLIFGGIKANGKLPISISRNIKMGMGLESTMPIRFNYTMPESIGLASSDLGNIDSIVQEGIENQAYPGAQVLIAKNGQVIYNKTFRKPSYESSVMVQPTDLYDIASVTKIA